ncbi:hypothetical protein UlMin_001274 [Ulmus minor]
MESSSSSCKKTLLLLILVHFMMPVSAARPLATDTNTQFIKTSCAITTYPELCFSTLSSYASKIQRKPQLLAKAALSEALKTARSTSSMMSKLSKSQGLGAGDAEALNDCVEELKDSLDELQCSIGEMGKQGHNFRVKLSNIQTWLSAALTDEDTCMDGFEGNSMNGSIKYSVWGYIVNDAHMISNALALINNYASTQSLLHA